MANSLSEAIIISAIGLAVVFLALLSLIILIKFLNFFVSWRKRDVSIGESCNVEDEEALEEPMSSVSANVTPRPDDGLEEIAILAATMYLAMEPASDGNLGDKRTVLPFSSETSILWRVQGRRDLMATQGNPRVVWRR